MRNIIALITTFTCLTLIGCNRIPSSDNGPVAVIDLDAIAQKLGKDKQILQMIEQRQGSLNEQVSSTQESLLQQLNQKKSEFGEVSDDEAKELALLQSKANSILTTTRTQAQSNLTNFQLEVVNRFRAEVKPIALELATKRGCRVVLSKNESVVFAFDDAIDLTDEVTAVLQSKVSSLQTMSSQANQAPIKQANSDQQANPTR